MIQEKSRNLGSLEKMLKFRFVLVLECRKNTCGSVSERGILRKRNHGDLTSQKQGIGQRITVITEDMLGFQPPGSGVQKRKRSDFSIFDCQKLELSRAARNIKSTQFMCSSSAKRFMISIDTTYRVKLLSSPVIKTGIQTQPNGKR